MGCHPRSFPPLLAKISWRSLTSMVPTMPPMAFGEGVPLGIFSKRPLWTLPCNVADGAVAAQLNNTLIRGPWQWPDFYGPAHNVAVSSSGPSREPNISGVFDRKKRWDYGRLGHCVGVIFFEVLKCD